MRSPGRLRSCFLRVNSTLLATELLRNILCSPYGIRTHILGLEDRCPVQLNEGTIFFVPLVGVEPTLLSELVSKTSACYQFRHKGIYPCLDPFQTTAENIWKGLKHLYPRRDSNSHVLTDTGFLDRGVYHSNTWAFCTPDRIRTDTCTGFKPVASADWATGAYKIKNPKGILSGLSYFGVFTSS